MPQVEIKVLAEDFKDNYWSNTEIENGCPLQRAFKRVGVLKSNNRQNRESFYNTSSYIKQKSVKEAEHKVLKMFWGDIPKEDFSFFVEA